VGNKIDFYFGLIAESRIAKLPGRAELSSRTDGSFRTRGQVCNLGNQNKKVPVPFFNLNPEFISGFVYGLVCELFITIP
jgi:hypothetical protein